MYIIINTKGKAVQSWSFAYKPTIIFCKSIGWAMRFSDRKAAERNLAYLQNPKLKFSESHDLRIVEVKYSETFSIV